MLKVFINKLSRNQRPLSTLHTDGPGYHQKPIPLRFLESSLDEAFLERLIGIGEAFFSSFKTPPKIKVQIFHYVPHLTWYNRKNGTVSLLHFYRLRRMIWG